MRAGTWRCALLACVLLTGDPGRPWRTLWCSPGEAAAAPSRREPSGTTEAQPGPEALRVQAQAEARAGRMEAAEKLSREAAEQLELALGPDHPETAAAWLELAELLQARGDRKSAFALARRADPIRRRAARIVTRALPWAEAARFEADHPSGVDLLLHLALEGQRQDQIAVAWDALVRSRSLVPDERARRERAERIHDPCANGASTAAERYARLLARPPTLPNDRGFRDSLEQARREYDRDEARFLAGRPKGCPTSTEAGLSDVLRALPPGSGLLAYARVTHGRWVADPAEDEFVALAATAGSSRLKLVRLARSSTVDWRVETWFKEVSSPPDPYRTGQEQWGRLLRASDVLHKTIWDPIGPGIGAAERVFVVPDGSLHMVNFLVLVALGELTSAPGIPLESLLGDSQLGHGPTLHLLSTERDLLAVSAGAGKGHGVLVVADPSFDALREEKRSDAMSTLHAGEASRVDTATTGEPRFEPVPWTRQEAEEVRQLWSDQGSDTLAGVLLGSEANERAICTAVPGHRVLHVATRGFILGGESTPLRYPAEPEPGASPGPSASTPGARSGEPVRSGLATSGANQAREAGRPEADGILSPDEIATLDLSGVEWVVLSIRWPGLGRFRDGEGLHALRRAFQLAGARTVITCMWSIDDEAVSLWVRELYRSRAAQGLGTAESMRAAATGVFEERRARCWCMHPFYWGAFVAVGDWR